MKLGNLSGPNGIRIARVKLASRWWHRLRGLLFRKPLAANGREALLMTPCSSMHTFGMTYPLDVIFLDRQQVVIRVCEYVAPWRIRLGPGASSVLELRAGAAAAIGLEVGDCLRWLEDGHVHSDLAPEGQIPG